MSALKKREYVKLPTEYAIEKEKSQNSAKRRKLLLHRRLFVFSIIAGAVAFFMISTLISQASDISSQSKEKKKTDAHLAELKKKEANLNEEIVKLNDEDYLAKLARKDYFLSEKGEIIFTIPDEKKK